jgi:hypothetical protein
VVDIPWPSDLIPWKVAFYLQAHTGGQESPLTRTTKKYGLSAPRWIARLTFRGGYDGAPRHGEQQGFGARLDGLIADLEGGLNIAVFHDFRRPRPLQPLSVVSALVADAAPTGATSLSVRGFARGGRAFGVGDYISASDGRPHLVSIAATIAAGGTVSGAGTVLADQTGRAIIGFKPPLSAPTAAGTALKWPATGRFELVSEDAGQNETEVRGLTEYVLDFTEKLT